MYYAIYIAIIITGLFLIGIILHFLVRKKLNESNAILWIFIGFTIILAGLFPKGIEKLSDFFLITYPPALIFTFAILILLLIVLKNSIIISELTSKTQETAMEASILRQELCDLTEKLDKLQMELEKQK